MRLAAAKEQMAYRDYLLRRLLPAMAASFNRRDADFDAASITTDNVMELHPDLPIVARATISELEIAWHAIMTACGRRAWHLYW